MSQRVSDIEELRRTQQEVHDRAKGILQRVTPAQGMPAAKT